MRIEEMIRKNIQSNIIGSEYIIKIQEDLGERGLKIYVYPSNRDGYIGYYILKDNLLFSISEQ